MPSGAAPDDPPLPESAAVKKKKQKAKAKKPSAAIAFKAALEEAEAFADADADNEPELKFPKRWSPSAIGALYDNSEEYFGNRMHADRQESNELNAKVNQRICQLIGRTCNFDVKYLGATIDNPLGPNHPRLPNTLAPLPFTPIDSYAPADRPAITRHRLKFTKAIHHVRGASSRALTLY
jgi:hypothetical protein